MARVVVVGGGFSGLAAAYRIERQLPGAAVTLLEERPRAGGVVGTVARDGFRVETGPNGFLDNNPATLELCRDLGLSGRLVPASESAGRNRFVFLDGRLRKLPSGPVGFLLGGVASWRSKWHLLTERFRPPGPGGDESVDTFARRRAGGAVADTLADAFVTGIYAGDPKLLSLPACFPRLAAFERESGSVTRGLSRARRQSRAEAAARGEPAPARPRMWSFPEGLGTLTEELSRRLRQPPLLGARATRVRRAAPDEAPSPWVVVGEGRDAWPADAVVLTCPTDRQAELLADLDPALAAEAAAVPYNAVAVAALGYRAADVPTPLDGFGYLSPQRARRDVLGVQWCSSTFPGRAPDGAVLLRALCGGWNRPEVVGWDDGRLVGAVRDELRQALGIEAAPVFAEVVRWPRAIPQYHLGHLDRVSRVGAACARHPGLFLGGNGYRGVALNDCAAAAAGLAGRVAAHLAATPAPPRPGP